MIGVMLSATSLLFAGAVAPAISPIDFDAGEPANYFWSLLAQPEVVALVLSMIGGLVGLIVRNRYVKRWRLEKAVEFLGAGVRETYEEYVRVAQKSHEDGKLTMAERDEAMRLAIRKAREYCKENGFDLFKIYAKEFVPVLVEKIIGVQKTYGRAVPFPGLVDLDPPSSSVGS